MQGDFDDDSRDVKVEEMLGQHEVSGTADRKEFGNPLDYRQHDQFQEFGHGIDFRGRRLRQYG